MGPSPPWAQAACASGGLACAEAVRARDALLSSDALSDFLHPWFILVHLSAAWPQGHDMPRRYVAHRGAVCAGDDVVMAVGVEVQTEETPPVSSNVRVRYACAKKAIIKVMNEIELTYA